MVWQFVMTTVIVMAVVLLPFVLLYLRRRWLTGQGGLRHASHADDVTAIALHAHDLRRTFQSRPLGATVHAEVTKTAAACP